MAQFVQEMTVAELEAMITRIVDDRLQRWLVKKQDTRSLDEIFESIDRNMWTPPPGAKSVVELLWEDRDH